MVSALRLKEKNPEVSEWAASIPIADLFISAFTISEIERGIISRKEQNTEQGNHLYKWFLNNVLPSFTNRIVPFDLNAARVLATLPVPNKAPVDDALIAATAIANDMIVATRNTRHFSHTGVRLLNPWK